MSNLPLCSCWNLLHSLSATNHKVDLNSELDCDSRNSKRELFGHHLNYVDKNSEATGRHFNLPGHTKWDMKVTVFKKIHSYDVWVRDRARPIIYN